MNQLEQPKAVILFDGIVPLDSDAGALLSETYSLEVEVCAPAVQYSEKEQIFSDSYDPSKWNVFVQCTAPPHTHPSWRGIGNSFEEACSDLEMQIRNNPTGGTSRDYTECFREIFKNF